MSSGVPTVAVLTPEQLQELVRGAVETALAERHEDAAPMLLDRARVARALGVGIATVDRLRREGMPCVFIGESPRFLITNCVEWLQRREQPLTDAPLLAGE
jgi:hypothetical protein